jgi:hypothetical protein
VRPAVINRDPEPSEIQVPVSTSIAFDLTDVGPDGIDTAATQVFVAGVLAFSGGVFQPGFDGPGSNATNPQPDTLRIVVDPVAAFVSLQQVPVRVVTRTVGGAFSLDTTWSFRCEDLTAPRVVAAQARALDRIRVSFDEPIQQEDPSASDDALNPARYRITRLSAPAVDVAPVAVEAVTDSAVEVLTDLVLTPGASYRIEVDGVADLFGLGGVSPGEAGLGVDAIDERVGAARVEHRLLEIEAHALEGFVLQAHEGGPRVVPRHVQDRPAVPPLTVEVGLQDGVGLQVAPRRALLGARRQEQRHQQGTDTGTAEHREPPSRGRLSRRGG